MLELSLSGCPSRVAILELPLSSCHFKLRGVPNGPTSSRRPRPTLLRQARLARLHPHEADNLEKHRALWTGKDNETADLIAPNTPASRPVMELPVPSVDSKPSHEATPAPFGDDRHTSPANPHRHSAFLFLDQGALIRTWPATGLFRRLSHDWVSPETNAEAWESTSAVSQRKLRRRARLRPFCVSALAGAYYTNDP